MVKRMHVVINPASGQPKPVLHTVNLICGELGVEWDASITKKSGDGHRFAQEALATDVDVVVAFGGDGSVMEVASALMGGQVPVAVLPGGTANVMSVELGIPKDLEKACRLACGQSSTIRGVDMGQIGERTFMLRVALGFDAEHVLGATREMKDRYGQLAYTISALEQLEKSPKARYKLTVDGEQFEYEGFTCRVDNSGNYGVPGLTFSQKTDVSDGLLDVTIIRDVDTGSLRSLLASGTGLGSPDPDSFFFRQAREITVDADPPQHVIGDGELWGETPISAKVLPQAVRFVVPGE